MGSKKKRESKESYSNVLDNLIEDEYEEMQKIKESLGIRNTHIE